MSPFSAPELVDVFHPGSDERAALKSISENPPDIAANVRAARARAAAQR
ncbi:MAG: hypothetical protein ACRDLF_13680 [Solirubrobacteraceae bacterium]